jgi:hypothetical protein
MVRVPPNGHEKFNSAYDPGINLIWFIAFFLVFFTHFINHGGNAIQVGMDMGED